jgi:putative acetyltransferase
MALAPTMMTPSKRSETGDRHPAAWTVYEGAGFTRCGAVLDYPDSKWSVFYEKSLAA